MKRLITMALIATTVWLTGCVVTSVYPYYTAKNLGFEPALVGVWRDVDAAREKSDSWTFDKLNEQSYKLTTRDNNETNEFDVHLFTLGDQKFLDCLQRERGAYAIPTHVLLRLNQLQPRLEMQFLDYRWLAELLEAKPKTIRHVIVPGPTPEKESMVTLTADTAELQKFVRKHLNNTNAWAEPLVMQRQ
jgi:hypothetical protein